MFTNKCKHLHTQYDKINDYNYCQDCEKIFFDDFDVLYNESELERKDIDDVENNLKRLNNL